VRGLDILSSRAGRRARIGLAAIVLWGCGDAEQGRGAEPVHTDAPGQSATQSAEARRLVSATQNRFALRAPLLKDHSPLLALAGAARGAQASVIPPSEAASFDRDGARLRPTLAAGIQEAHAQLLFGPTASHPFRITDTRSGLWLEVAAPNARGVPAETADGYLVYRDALGTGSSIIHRVEAGGTEDFVVCADRTAAASVSYEVDLSPEVAGLRLVSNTLEALDASGAPRLRMSPPYVISGDGRKVELLPAVAGCAVDENPAPPWGRAVTPPGSRHCRIDFRWNPDEISYPALLDPAWVSTRQMNGTHSSHTATTLSLGNALIVGGLATDGTELATAEVYNLPSDTWATVQQLPARYARRSHTATLLTAGPNAGRVLVAGGFSAGTGLASTLLYDPPTGTWRLGPPLAGKRYGHTATPLPDGRVLIVGGLQGGGTWTYATNAELYEPLSMRFTPAGAPLPGRYFAAASVVSDGLISHSRVLISGGLTATGALAETTLFDPKTNAFSAGPPMTAARGGHIQVSHPVGSPVLVAGGLGANWTVLGTAERFNGSTWLPQPSMAVARQVPCALLLREGVLVTGGSASPLAEFYNLFTQTWSSAGSMSTARFGAAVCDLGDVALISGGADGSQQLSSSELYFPVSPTRIP